VRQRGDVEALGPGQHADPVLVELRVEFGFNHRLSSGDVFECDRWAVVLAPCVPAVILEEERVALGEIEHAARGLLVPFHSLALGRGARVLTCRTASQRSDLEGF
jgi:hypothetical protein